MPYFLLSFAILLSVFGVLTMPLVLYLAPVSLRKYYAPIVILVISACCFALLKPAYTASSPFDLAISFPPAFDIVFSAWPLSAIFAAVISFACFAISIKLNIIDKKNTQTITEEIRINTLFLFFAGSLTAICFTGSLLWLYIFWQLAILCLYFFSIEAAEKKQVQSDSILIALSSGALFMLAGAILIYLNQGSFSIDTLTGDPITFAKALFIFIGLITPLLITPMAANLQISSEKSASSNFLSLVFLLSFTGCAVFAKIFCAGLAAPEKFFNTVSAIVLLFMFACAWYAAKSAQNKQKQTASALAIAQGFIFIAFSSYTNIGFSSGLISILAQIPAVLGLLMLSEIDEENISGFSRFTYAMCAIALAGIPPAGEFFSRFMLFMAEAQNGKIWLFVFSLLANILLFFALFRLFGAHMQKNYKQPSESAISGLAIEAFALGFICLLIGIFIYYPSSYTAVTAAVQGVNLQ